MQLQRQLNSKQLWAMTVGMVISGQYFGWNYGLANGIGSFIIATIIVSIFYICFMLTYTQLAVSMPTSGGPMQYANRAYGKRFSAVIGIACLFEFLFAIPAIAIASGSYLHFLIQPVNAHLAALGFIIFFIFLNLRPLKNSARLEMVATILAIVGLVVFYFFGLKNSNAIAINSITAHKTMSAIPFAIWLYLAIEGGALTAEEVKSPSKTLPRGLLLAIATIFILSILTVYTSGTLASSRFATLDYPLAAALGNSKHIWQPAIITVSCLGLFGLIASLNGIIIAGSRQLFALSRAGFLPKRLQKISKNNTPQNSVLAIGLISIGCTMQATFAGQLVKLSVLAAMLMYLGALVSWFKLNYVGQLQNTSYRVPNKIIPFIATIVCLICLAAIINSYNINKELSIAIISAMTILVAYTVFRRPRQQHSDPADYGHSAD